MARWVTHRTDTTQEPLVAFLERQGCVYQHAGEPIDGWLWVPTRTGHEVVPVEFKTGKKKLRKSQERFREKWPGPFYQLSTEIECRVMLSELQR